MQGTELEVFKLIASSGEARGSAFEALRLAKVGKFEEAEAKLVEAKEKSQEAHNVQTSLITRETQGDKTEITLLMVHAQDHLMTTLLARDLIEELVSVIEELKKEGGK